MESARRDEAQTALFANEARDKDIKEIERSLKGLTEISDALNKLVIEQGTAIENIEQQGEVVVDHVAKANVEMEGAITNARSARRKKFWCLGIARKFYGLQDKQVISSLWQFFLSSSLLSSLSSSF